MAWLNLYLLTGIALAEGARWARGRAGLDLRAGAYLVIVLLWPLMIIMTALRKV